MANFPDYPDHRTHLARALEMLGGVLRKSGKPEEGEVLTSRSNDIREKLVTEFPDRVGYRRELAQFLQNRAQELVSHPEAPGFDPARALDLARRSVALDPANQLCWKWLGLVEYRNGHWDEAILAAEKCIDLQ